MNFTQRTPLLAIGQKGVSVSAFQIGVRTAVRIGPRNGADMTFLGALMG